MKFDHKMFDISVEDEQRLDERPLPELHDDDHLRERHPLRLRHRRHRRVRRRRTTRTATRPTDCGDNIDNGPDGPKDVGDLDCWDDLGFALGSGEVAAVIHVLPEADLPFRIRPGKDNGVMRRLLDENCEVADIYGDIFPETNAGLTPDCSDIDITVRRLEGDLDMDCDVDVIDAQRIAFRYGSFFGQLLYNHVLRPGAVRDARTSTSTSRTCSTCSAASARRARGRSRTTRIRSPAEGVGQP